MQKFNLIEFLTRYTEDADQSELFKLLQGLPSISADGPWIAGGSVRRTLQVAGISEDIDYFFKSEEQKKAFEEDLKNLGFTETSKTDHATTYHGMVGEEKVKVQAIHFMFYESPEAVIDSFDFTITQFAYDGTDVYCGDYSLWDLGRKKLALHKLTFGVSTLRRVIKYTKQGFTACGGVLADILERTIENPETLNREVQYVD